MIDEPRTRRFSDPLFALFGVRLVVWLAVVRAVVPAIFSEPWKLAAYHDEHFYYAHEEAAKITIARYHQVPAWNPYYCGGIPGVANPQDSTFAPEFLLKLVYGVGPGRHLAYLLFFVLGMEGTYRLSRRLGASGLGAMLAGAVFATSGFFLDVLKLGWLNFFSFELVPWVAWAFLCGLSSMWHRVLGGLFIAWMVVSGGLYSGPYTVLMLGALLVLTTGEIALGERRDDRPPWWSPMAAFATIGVVAALVCAVKLLPMMKIVFGFPRLWEGTEAQPLANILARLTTPAGHDGQPGFVGSMLLVLALVGAAFDRNGARALAMSTFFFLLALGDFADYAPNMLLHKLPVMGQLRFPHRFVVMVALWACVGAAIGIGRIEDLVPAIGRALRDLVVLQPLGGPSPLARLAFGAVGALLAGKIAWTVYEGFRDESKLDNVFVMDSPIRREAPFKQSRGNRWDAQVWAPASLGTLQCFEETAFPMSAKLAGNAPAEEYPLDPDAATVQRVSWTPNVITLHVVAKANTTVVVNQNWNAAWRSNIGSVRAADGLLAVDVPAGDHQVVLKYRDRSLQAGLVVSVLSLLGLAFFAVREARVRLLGLRASWDALPRA